MQKPKKRDLPSPKKSIDWLKYIDDCLPGFVIPVGPRFQAVTPECDGLSDDCHESSLSSDSYNTRWLGTRVWPPQNEDRDLKQINSAEPTVLGDSVGKGRPDFCKCSSPGSTHCVKLHISEARKRLRSNLGPAYESWRFDEMGEVVGRSWLCKQKTKFDEIVKTNPVSVGKSFLKPAEASFHSKTRKEIISYYLNVHVPKRISMLSRSGCEGLDSDDDEVEASNAVNPLKRSRSNHVDITQLVRPHYLSGRR